MKAKNKEDLKEGFPSTYYEENFLLVFSHMVAKFSEDELKERCYTKYKIAKTGIVMKDGEHALFVFTSACELYFKHVSNLVDIRFLQLNRTFWFSNLFYDEKEHFVYLVTRLALVKINLFSETESALQHLFDENLIVLKKKGKFASVFSSDLNLTRIFKEHSLGTMYQ